MKSVRYLLILGYLASLSTASHARQSPEEMIAFAKAFCLAVGWEFTPGKVQARRIELVAGNRWRVSSPEVSLILNENPTYVRIGHSSAMRAARRTTKPNPQAPFVSGEADWFSQAKGIVNKVVAGSTFLKLRYKETLLQIGPTPMYRTNANSALISLQVTSPAILAGDQITVIMDRANGKLLSYSYSKKRG
jgi:hypothetical protein